jgi:hypothetical protein
MRQFPYSQSGEILLSCRRLLIGCTDRWLFLTVCPLDDRQIAPRHDVPWIWHESQAEALEGA